MKFQLDKEQIEEIVCCIVDCGFGRDEAIDYAFKTATLMQDVEDAELIEY